MSALDPILDALRQRMTAAGDDQQERNEAVMSVAEAATELDVQLEEVTRGMTVLPIFHPLIAANQNVRTLLWHNVQRQLLPRVANKQRPILVDRERDLSETDRAAYDAEVDRLAALVGDILTRRLGR